MLLVMAHHGQEINYYLNLYKMNKKAIIKSVLAAIAVVLLTILVGYVSIIFPRILLVVSGLLWLGLMIRMFYEIFKPKE